MLTSFPSKLGTDTPHPLSGLSEWSPYPINLGEKSIHLIM